MLSPDQLHHILGILDKQILFFVGRTLGGQLLTDHEKSILKDAGINVKNLMDQSNDLVTLNFQLGMLSNVLADQRVRDMNYDQLVKYIQYGKYIPLTAKEKAVIQNIQMQSLADIRSARGRIFQDINNVVGQQFATVRANQEQFIREQIVDGVAQRKSRKNIAREIAKLTGDWSRDFTKSVQYISHTALNEGRGAIIDRRSGGVGKAKVYFQVQGDACPNCKGAYLKPNGEPIVFILSELQANGTNIGKKQKDWLPTVGALHPHCRCLLTEYMEGSEWDGQRFVQGKRTETKIARPLIRIEFNGKEYFV